MSCNMSLSLLSGRTGHAGLQMYGTSSALYASHRRDWNRRPQGLDEQLLSNLFSWRIRRSTATCPVYEWFSCTDVFVPALFRLGRSLQTEKCYCDPSIDASSIAIIQSWEEDGVVQHAPIASVGQYIISLLPDRHHPPSIVVTARLERAKKLASMLLLIFAQRMFCIDKLGNETKTNFSLFVSK